MLPGAGRAAAAGDPGDVHRGTAGELYVRRRTLQDSSMILERLVRTANLVNHSSAVACSGTVSCTPCAGVRRLTLRLCEL